MARKLTKVFDKIKYSLYALYTRKSRAQDEAEYWRRVAKGGPFGARVIKNKNTNKYEVWVSVKKLSEKY